MYRGISLIWIWDDAFYSINRVDKKSGRIDIYLIRPRASKMFGYSSVEEIIDKPVS